MQRHNVGGAALFGACIQGTRGIYPAELQAIARTLAMLPASFNLHIHADSQASLAAIRSYELQNNERKRLRMPSRPLLQLIHHLLRGRAAGGGSASWHHVKAHSRETDIHSVGNRLSDYQAELSRAGPDRSKPLTLCELPLSQCEHHLSITDTRSGLLMIDDARRTALTQLQASALTKWQNKRDGREYFAGSAVCELGRTVLRCGSPDQQLIIVHVATNSIQHHWQPGDGAAVADRVVELQCSDCDTAIDLAHLAECPGPVATDFRGELQRAITDSLARTPQAAAWSRSHRRLQLPSLLLSLFPYPAAVASTAPLSIERRRHVCFAMCGVLTSSQLTSAARAVGFAKDEVEDGRRCMHELQLLCLSHIQRLYADLKPPAVS